MKINKEYLSNIKKILSNHQVKTMLIIFFISCLIIDINIIKEQQDNVYENEVSPKTFIANRDYNYINYKEIDKQLTEFEKQNQQFYKYINDSEKKINNEISNINSLVNEITKIKSQTRSDKLYTALRDYSAKKEVDYNTVIAISNNLEILTYQNITFLEDKIISALKQDGGFTESSLNDKKNEMNFYIDNLITNEILRLYFKDMINENLMPTKIIDEKKNEEFKNQKILELQLKYTEYYKKGQRIIDEGKIITAKELDIINELGLNSNSTSIIKYVKMNVLFLFLLIGLILISRKIDNINLNKNKQKLMNVLVLLSIFLISFSKMFNLSTMGLFIFIPLIIIVADIFLSKRISLYFSIICSLIIGMITNDILVMSIYLIIGLSSILVLREIKSRSALTKYSLITMLITIFAIYLVDVNNILVLNNYYMIALNILISFFISINIFSIIEKLFNIITPFTLMELQQHPVLEELSVKAPGTMSHSINVANLAKNAAFKIGADAQLLYTGALFHDIGKLHDPIMFTENHTHFNLKENPHNKLNCYDSALMIKRHIEYGITLGEKYKLPNEIINLIKTHHGNSVIKYFYHKAIESNSNKKHPPNIKDYSYHWGKPQTKEEGILMLCDIAEAVSKSFDNISKEYLEEKIPLYLNEVINSGELNECNLNLKEIKKIEESIIETLVNLNVKRTKYQNQK